jgi:hypothetical protein
MGDKLLRRAKGATDYGISGSPALAVYSGKLYSACRGQGNSGQIVYQTSDGTTWSDQKLVRNFRISASPALAVYKNKLYLAHQGDGNSGQILYTTFDGTNWTDDTLIKNCGISGSPALAVYKGRLYLAHQGYGGSGEIWYTTFDGMTWSKDTLIVNCGMSESPALAVYNGELYLAHQGYGNSGQILYTTFDGTTWASDTLIAGCGMSASPALAVFGKLYLAHQGYGAGGDFWYTAFNGQSWSADTLVRSRMMSASPALAMFKGRLFRVEQGYGNDGQVHWNSSPYIRINFPVPLLDVWGEGRIVADKNTSGFYEAQNLNHIKQPVSNGPNKGQAIPSLVPVESFDAPQFPIADGMVSYMTLMGSEIVPAAAKEMYRVLNKTNGVVILYNAEPQDVDVFEKNKGKLILKPQDPLNWPFDEISFGPGERPTRIYGFPGVQDHDEL